MHDAGRASELKLAALEDTAVRQRLPAETTVRHDCAVARPAISWDGTCIIVLTVFALFYGFAWLGLAGYRLGCFFNSGFPSK